MAVAARPVVAARSTVRKPKRLKSQVVAGLMAMLPTKTKSTTLPDLIALQPNTVWNSNGSRNGIAPTTSQNIELPLMAAPKVGMRSVRRLMSGTGVRSRCQAPATDSAAAARTRTIASVQRGVPSDTTWPAYVMAPSAPQVSTTPSLSSGGGFPVAVSVISRQAKARATIPSGTLMANIHCQLA